MARNVEHERIVADKLVDTPWTTWQWSKFVRCRIKVHTKGLLFHQCEFEDCTYEPNDKKGS